MAIKNTPFSPSKLVETLQLLTPKEFRSFGKYLQSPWCNSQKNLVDLFQLIERKYPDFNHASLTREGLFSQLYPGKKYDDKWMRNIMTAMTNQAETFLTQLQLQKKKPLQQKLLADAFSERHRADWYEQKIRNLIHKMEKKKVKETEDYLLLHLVHKDLYYQSNRPQEFEPGATPLQIADLYLDTFFSISKWRHITEMNERQALFTEDNAIEEKLHLLHSLTGHYDLPSTRMYQWYYDFKKSPGKDNYFHLRNNIFAEFDRIPFTDQRLLVLYLINSVIRLWLQGETSILKELLTLYQKGLEYELLTDHGRISAITFSNIVTTGNSLEAFDFVRQFIDDYSVRLAQDQIKDGQTWANGHLHLKQGNFDACLKDVSVHPFTDPHFSVMAKNLLLEAYFEACISDDSYYLFFKDFIKAFKKYIRRNKTVYGSRKTAYLNFANYTAALIKLKVESCLTPEELDSLRNLIHEEKELQSKQWLLKKIRKLEKNLVN